MPTNSFTERIYKLISGDEVERLCDQAPAASCTNLPRNFVLNAASGALTKLAEQIASPGLVIAWLMATLGAPAILTGLLVPIRQTGALLPQFAVAAKIRKLERRKWVWVLGAVIRTVSLLGIVVAAASLEGVAAGIAILCLLAVFSLAAGAGSVAFSDVVGKTIPKGRRGRLLATRSCAGGLLALVAGLIIKYYFVAEQETTPYLLLIATAALLWLAGAVLFARIDEEKGSTEGGKNTFSELLESISLLRSDRGLRRFLLARALLLSVELAAPFFVLYFRDLAGGELQNLALFLIALSLAEVISSPFWGVFADRASGTVMALGAVVAVLAIALALILGALPTVWHNPYLFSISFLFLGVAGAGVRLGRKTFLVDYAPPAKRPTYIALTNTSIGMITLLGGSLGVIAQLFGIEILMTLLAALALAGTVACRKLPSRT